MRGLVRLQPQSLWRHRVGRSEPIREIGSHAQRFEQLAKRNDVIKQVFEDPHIAGTNARERAIVLFSIDLTMRPQIPNRESTVAVRPRKAARAHLRGLLRSDVE